MQHFGVQPFIRKELHAAKGALPMPRTVSEINTVWSDVHSANAPLPITLIIVKSEARIRKFETASQMVLSANISKYIR